MITVFQIFKNEKKLEQFFGG